MEKLHIESKVRKGDKGGQYSAASFVAKDTASQFRMSKEQQNGASTAGPEPVREKQLSWQN